MRFLAAGGVNATATARGHSANSRSVGRSFFIDVHHLSC